MNQLAQTHIFAGLSIDRLATVSHRALQFGRAVALLGVVLPLLLIGVLKFTEYEINALKPLISGTPWLAWLYSVFGEAGTSYLLGVVEVITALLLLASPMFPRAALAGGALAVGTFAVTVSTMFALPIWEASLGGYPYLGALGQFLIKDVALLGVSLFIFGEGLAKVLAKAKAGSPRDN